MKTEKYGAYGVIKVKKEQTKKITNEKATTYYIRCDDGCGMLAGCYR